MRQRCTNPQKDHYADYGGRGIIVCPEWENSFEAFRDWALANGYRDDLTIDRKDNDGPYSPENCRWATKSEQVNNTRANRYLEYNGERKTIAEWARVVGINPRVIAKRIRNGWTVERALTEDINKQKNK